ncbi:FAD-binding protein [Microbacterium sp. MPKO10]|uniref:FAD-binding protein n=1 Tax=Microbacterium sp. MPKO10 TaxID=2989818 RepID=UPI002236B7FE|nr:FAD-binding protein [Microbacterium sp. MPKO10]MCW4458710.1 FAD-binding protein [Microbacterium sp. MPKO10]
MSLEIGTNWAGNLAFGAQRIVAPTTAREVQDVLADAASTGARVRAVGSRHSFNTIADTPGVLLATSALDSAPVIDEAARTVTVGAGIRYGELGAELQRAGWALSNLASLPHISVAGAIATGTHGSGNRVPSLAAAVAGLELVTASGDIVTLRRGDADFDAAVVSLGALGIVTRVTLDIEPTFDVAQHVYERLPLERVLENFDAISGAGYSVSMFTTWRDPDTVDQVWVKRRVDADAAAPTDMFGALPASVARHPLPGISAEFCTAQLGAPGAWIDRLPHFRLDFTPSNGDELQTEYLVPRTRIGDALEVMRAMHERVAPLLQVNEIRTVPADDLWLSPAYGHDVVGLHLTWLPAQADVEVLLAELEERLLPLGARPHWGKLFAADSAALHAAYPKLADFRGVAERYDPNSMFRNDFVRRVFGA